MLGVSTILRRFGFRVDQNGQRIWTSAFGVGSWAGKSVTPDTAMQLGCFWACVRKISSTVATLPIAVYRRMPDGSRELAATHPLHAILKFQPNADQEPYVFLGGLVAQMLVWGNAFAEIVKDSDRIVALNLLRSDLMTVQRDRLGSLVYRYAAVGGELREYGEDEILHVRSFGFGEDLGMSIVAYARQTLGMAIATDEAAARTFANGLRPGGVITYEGQKLLSPEQREQAKASLIEPFTGTENAGKTLLLEGAAGFKWQPASMPPKDAEMLATRRWHVEEVCRWFDVPPILVGHASEGQTMWGSGIEQIMLGWLTTGLRPHLNALEQCFNRQLIAPGERSTYYAEFTVEGLLRADSAGRAELYSKLIGVAAITPNQIADRENLPRFDGGDVHLVNSTLVPLDQAGRKPARVQPAPGEPILEDA